MKIYFAGSIRGGRDDRETYEKLIHGLASHGEVLTEHVGDAAITEAGEDGPSDGFIFTRDVNWIRDADLVVAECTTPSLGVGYELAFAESLGKRILCLWRPCAGKRLSAMITGNPYLTVRDYETVDDALQAVAAFIA